MSKEKKSSGETISAIFTKSAKEKAEAKTYRFKCVCAYDGTDFRGWQSQASSDSVQDFIEYRLKRIFKCPIRIHGSGRTDAGVHANAQVFHFDAQWKHDCATLKKALQPSHIMSVDILSVQKVSKDFHARYSVKGKRYVYRIFEGRASPQTARYRWSLHRQSKLDIDAMNDAAQIFIGEHDFTAFSATHGANAKKVSPIKKLFKLEVVRRGREVKVVTEGSGYLYRMVRMLTGALVAVGIGKLTKADLQNALESKTRDNLFEAAPASGLFLDKVFYKTRKTL